MISVSFGPLFSMYLCVYVFLATVFSCDVVFCIIHLKLKLESLLNYTQLIHTTPLFVCLKTSTVHSVWLVDRKGKQRAWKVSLKIERAHELTSFLRHTKECESPPLDFENNNGMNRSRSERTCLNNTYYRPVIYSKWMHHYRWIENYQKYHCWIHLFVCFCTRRLILNWSISMNFHCIPFSAREFRAVYSLNWYVVTPML